VFATGLEHDYRRDSVVIHGNVAPATHGETKIETLGGGDATVPFQRFTLKQKPLTCVSSDNPHGWESTLKIRVNGVLWEETGSFFGVGPEEHVYVTRLGDDGTVTVQFGDGVTGARLPSGVENITATYRVGTGEAGLLKAGQLSLLMSRPLGLKEAVNPSAPSGGEDPEHREDARRNAPFTVLTLGRIVSLQDYEDFARAFAGIGKARATLLWNGEQRLVHLTVSGVNGFELPSNSNTLRNLRDAIDGARHENHEARLAPHQSKPFKLSAGILIDPARVPDDVLDAVNEALLEAFAFEARGFGQAVTAAEVLAVMQRVDGVIAVDLDALHFSTETPKRRERLPANIARWASGQILPAELLTLDPEGIDLTEKPA
jgi:predicted phage baseplate assembly protein